MSFERGLGRSALMQELLQSDSKPCAPLSQSYISSKRSRICELLSGSSEKQGSTVGGKCRISSKIGSLNVNLGQDTGNTTMPVIKRGTKVSLLDMSATSSAAGPCSPKEAKRTIGTTVEKKNQKKQQHTNKKASSSMSPITNSILLTKPDKHTNFLLALTPAGKSVGIMLDHGTPESFKNYAEKIEWQKNAAETVLNLNKDLEIEYLSAELMKDVVELYLCAPTHQVERLKYVKETVAEIQRQKYLRLEGSLIDLNQQIRATVGLAKADVDKCVVLLEKFKDLEITSLMLKKNPNCVQTMERLRRYTNKIKHLLADKILKETVAEIQRQKYLRLEGSLIDLNQQIRATVGLAKADVDKCLVLLEKFKDLEITPLMLKKNPNCVQTMERLRRYTGNLKEWKISDEEKLEFAEKAEKIRQQSEYIYNNYKKMFHIPEGKPFWEGFMEEVDNFKERINHLLADKILKETVAQIQRQKYLRLEGSLIDLNQQIKATVGLVKADVDKCLVLLEKFKDLEITPLMRKKNPNCAQTMERLRRYTGNLKKWKWEMEVKWEGFMEEVDNFKERIKHLLADKILKETVAEIHRQKYLKLEGSLIDLNQQIKATVGLAKTDFDKCLVLLEKFKDLEITPLMRKKNPNCVQTMERLRRYTGNLKKWKWEMEVKWGFMKEVDNFKERIKHLLGDKILRIIEQPDPIKEVENETLAQEKHGNHRCNCRFCIVKFHN